MPLDQIKDRCERQGALRTLSPVGTALEWAVPHGHGAASPGEVTLHTWPSLGPGHKWPRQWTTHSEQQPVVEEGREGGNRPQRVVNAQD